LNYDPTDHNSSVLKKSFDQRRLVSKHIRFAIKSLCGRQLCYLFPDKGDAEYFVIFVAPSCLQSGTYKCQIISDNKVGL